MNESKREHVRSEDSSFLDYDKGRWVSCSRHVERASFLHRKRSSNTKIFFFLELIYPPKTHINNCKSHKIKCA